MGTGGLIDALPGPSSLDTLGVAAVYAVVFGFVFAECGLLIGFLLPGDTLLVAAGAAAATQSGRISLTAMAAGTFAAAVVGEAVGYLIGARAGPALLRRRGRILSPDSLARAEHLTDRYGSLAVLAARWVPWVRTFVPTLAGATRMSWPRFMLANVVGALCWAPTLVMIGYFAASVPALRPVALVAAGVAVAATLVTGVVRWRRAARLPGGDRRGGHPADGGDGDDRADGHRADGGSDAEPRPPRLDR